MFVYLESATCGFCVDFDCLLTSEQAIGRRVGEYSSSFIDLKRQEARYIEGYLGEKGQEQILEPSSISSANLVTSRLLSI